MAKTAVQLERELKTWTNLFPNQKPEEIKKLLEQVSKKPDTVDKGTQTEELTLTDINNMEVNNTKIIDFIKKTNFIKDEDKNKDISFKLAMIERGIAGFKEELDHSKTNGREIESKLKLLQEALEQGKLNEQELMDKVNNLTNLLKRKETEYQQSLKIGEEKYKEIEEKFKRKKAKAHKFKTDLKGWTQDKANLEEEINNKTNQLLGKDKELAQEIKEKEDDIANLKNEINKKNNDLKKIFLVNEKKLDELNSKGLSDEEFSFLKKFISISRGIIIAVLYEVENISHAIPVYLFNQSSEGGRDEIMSNAFALYFKNLNDIMDEAIKKEPLLFQKQESILNEIKDYVNQSQKIIHDISRLSSIFFSSATAFEKLEEAYKELKTQKEETDKLIKICDEEKFGLELQSRNLRDRIFRFEKDMDEYEVKLTEKEEKLKEKTKRLDEINRELDIIVKTKSTEEYQKVWNEKDQEIRNLRNGFREEARELNNKITSLTSQLNAARSESNSISYWKSQYYTFQDENIKLRKEIVELRSEEEEFILVDNVNTFDMGQDAKVSCNIRFIESSIIFIPFYSTPDLSFHIIHPYSEFGFEETKKEKLKKSSLEIFYRRVKFRPVEKRFSWSSHSMTSDIIKRKWIDGRFVD